MSIIGGGSAVCEGVDRRRGDRMGNQISNRCAAKIGWPRGTGITGMKKRRD